MLAVSQLGYREAVETAWMLIVLLGLLLVRKLWVLDLAEQGSIDSCSDQEDWLW